MLDRVDCFHLHPTGVLGGCPRAPHNGGEGKNIIKRNNVGFCISEVCFSMLYICSGFHMKNKVTPKKFQRYQKWQKF
jgi:hypothetical protein